MPNESGEKGVLTKWSNLPYFWKSIIGGFLVGFITGLFPLFLAFIAPFLREVFRAESSKDNWKIGIGIIFAIVLIVINGPALLLMNWFFGLSDSSSIIFLPLFQGVLFSSVFTILVVLNKMKATSQIWNIIFWLTLIIALIGYFLLIVWNLLGGLAG